MSEQLKRRSLLEGLDTTRTAPSDAAISVTAERNGFSASTPEMSLDQTRVTLCMRRQRQPTGRVHQFNVRLRSDTLEAIYAQANGRNVPVAQIIEEAVAALSLAS